MEKIIPWGKIVDFLFNKQSEEDKDLKNWVAEDTGNQELINELFVVDRLANQIPDSFTPDMGRAWEKVQMRISTEKSIGTLTNYLLKIAAVLIFILIGFGIHLLLFPKSDAMFTKIHSPNGQKTHVLLPDSSKVILNGGTTIAFKQDFSNERKVELSGEALFEVRKQGGARFIVQTPEINIEVLGTKFNVKAYEEELDIEISLVEGSVELVQNQKIVTDLAPGQVALLNKSDNRITRKYDDVQKNISWSLDQLIFEENTFEEIEIYLERWYGVDIELDASLKNEHRYTFSVKSESLRELLDLISLITPIEYKIDGKKVRIAKNQKSLKSLPMIK